MGQSGITLLPDRDYYLKDDPQARGGEAQYLAYLQTIFTLIKRADPAGDAKAVVALETERREDAVARADLRDPVKRYNKCTLARLAEEMPGFDWSDLGRVARLRERPGRDRRPAVLLQGLRGAGRHHASGDVEGVAHGAPRVRGSGVPEQAFRRRAVRVLQSHPARPAGHAAAPRSAAVQLVNASLGEALGRIYVGKYFPAEAKVRMQQMVANLLEAYRQSITTVDWMTPETRKRALDKLSKFMPKIGYPDTWRSYDGVVIKADDLAGNAMRLARFERTYRRGKLGKPVDRSEWVMTPQTVNAYYSPVMNKIVFPAAILQPPFFQFDADDAVNYGAIGAVIGHEIGHGFDDSGRRFDGTARSTTGGCRSTIRNSASVRSCWWNSSISSRRCRACT